MLLYRCTFWKQPFVSHVSIPTFCPCHAKSLADRNGSGNGVKTSYPLLQAQCQGSFPISGIFVFARKNWDHTLCLPVYPKSNIVDIAGWKIHHDKDIAGWWQLKYLLCSPLKLGKWFPFWLIFFNWVGWNHQPVYLLKTPESIAGPAPPLSRPQSTSDWVGGDPRGLDAAKKPWKLLSFIFGVGVILGFCQIFPGKRSFNNYAQRCSGARRLKR